MAASYQTGISSSPTNLLQTIASWLATQGWTIDSSVSESTGWRVHAHKGSLYVNLRAAGNEKIWPSTAGSWDRSLGYGIGLYLGDGYDGGESWHAQSGRPLRIDGSTSGCGMNLPSGSVTGYHLFDDGNDNIIVVVEKSPGIFCHMGWGPRLSPAGTPEDFPYFFGSSPAYRNTDSVPDVSRHGITTTAWPPLAFADSEPNQTYYLPACAFIRVDSTTFSGRWVALTDHDASIQGGTGRRMASVLNLQTYNGLGDEDWPNYGYIANRVHQTAFAGALLLPIHTFAMTDPAARWAPCGYPPNIFYCRAVSHGYAAGSILSVGGVNYMLFPYFAVLKAA